MVGQVMVQVLLVSQQEAPQVSGHVSFILQVVPGSKLSTPPFTARSSRTFKLATVLLLSDSFLLKLVFIFLLLYFLSFLFESDGLKLFPLYFRLGNIIVIRMNIFTEKRFSFIRIVLFPQARTFGL
ncbi:MAG: hypothetical protein QG657_2998 [Acidobacteriota bacterium]|nr:hypothetical protein [Acidobacteriota bacterium]